MFPFSQPQNLTGMPSEEQLQSSRLSSPSHTGTVGQHSSTCPNILANASRPPNIHSRLRDLYDARQNINTTKQSEVSTTQNHTSAVPNQGSQFHMPNTPTDYSIFKLQPRNSPVVMQTVAQTVAKPVNTGQSTVPNFSTNYQASIPGKAINLFAQNELDNSENISMDMTAISSVEGPVTSETNRYSQRANQYQSVANTEHLQSPIRSESLSHFRSPSLSTGPEFGHSQISQPVVNTSFSLLWSSDLQEFYSSQKSQPVVNTVHMSPATKSEALYDYQEPRFIHSLKSLPAVPDVRVPVRSSVPNTSEVTATDIPIVPSKFSNFVNQSDKSCEQQPSLPAQQFIDVPETLYNILQSEKESAEHISTIGDDVLNISSDALSYSAIPDQHSQIREQSQSDVTSSAISINTDSLTRLQAENRELSALLMDSQPASSSFLSHSQQPFLPAQQFIDVPETLYNILQTEKENTEHISTPGDQISDPSSNAFAHSTVPDKHIQIISREQSQSNVTSLAILNTNSLTPLQNENRELSALLQNSHPVLSSFLRHSQLKVPMKNIQAMPYDSISPISTAQKNGPKRVACIQAVSSAISTFDLDSDVNGDHEVIMCPVPTTETYSDVLLSRQKMAKIRKITGKELMQTSTINTAMQSQEQMSTQHPSIAPSSELNSGSKCIQQSSRAVTCNNNIKEEMEAEKTNERSLLVTSVKEEEDCLEPVTRSNSPTRRCTDNISREKAISHTLVNTSVMDRQMGNCFKMQIRKVACAIGSNCVFLTPEGTPVFTPTGEPITLDLMRYWCNYCSFKTEKEDVLIQHILEHRFKCQVCDFEAFSRTEVLNHSLLVHINFEEQASTLKYSCLLVDYSKIKMSDVKANAAEKRKFNDSNRPQASAKCMKKEAPQVSLKSVIVERIDGLLNQCDVPEKNVFSLKPVPTNCVKRPHFVETVSDDAPSPIQGKHVEPAAVSTNAVVTVQKTPTPRLLVVNECVKRLLAFPQKQLSLETTKHTANVSTAKTPVTITNLSSEVSKKTGRVVATNDQGLKASVPKNASHPHLPVILASLISRQLPTVQIPKSMPVCSSNSIVFASSSSKTIDAAANSVPITIEDNSGPVAVEENSGPVEVKDSSEPVAVEGNSEPVRTKDNCEPVKTEDYSEPVTNKDNSEPVTIEDNSEPVTNKDNSKPVTNKDHSEPVTNKDNSKPVTNKDNSEPVTNKDNSEPVRNKDNSKPVTNKDNSEPVTNKDNSEPVTNKDNSEPVTNKDNSEPVTIEDDDHPFQITGGRVSKRKKMSKLSSSDLCWKCGYCKFVTHQQGVLRDHISCKHGNVSHRYIALPPNYEDSEADESDSSEKPSQSPAPLQTTSSHTNSSARKSGRKVYKCALCSFTESSSVLIKKHMLLTHPGSLFYTIDLKAVEMQKPHSIFFCHKPDCSFHTKETDNYIKHTETCTPHLYSSKDLQGEDIEMKNSLDVTLSFAKNMYKTQPNVSVASSCGDKYVCLYCSYSSRTNTLVKKHTVSNHEKRLSVMRDEHVDKNKQLVYFCRHCLWETHIKSMLKLHLVEKHKDTDEVEKNLNENPTEELNLKRKVCNSPKSTTATNEGRYLALIESLTAKTQTSGKATTAKRKSEKTVEENTFSAKKASKAIQQLLVEKHVRSKHGSLSGAKTFSQSLSDERTVSKSTSYTTDDNRKGGIDADAEVPLYRCSWCAVMFYNVENSKRHLLTKHGNVILQAIDICRKQRGDEVPFAYFCPEKECFFSSDAASKLVEHIISLHDYMTTHPYIVTLIKTLKETQKMLRIKRYAYKYLEQYKCSCCSAGHVTQSVLHMKKHFINTHPKDEILFSDVFSSKQHKRCLIHMCSEKSCDFLTTDLDEFKLHGLGHQYTRVYECENCSWFTTAADDLPSHNLEQHQNEDIAIIEFYVTLDEHKSVVKEKIDK